MCVPCRTYSAPTPFGPSNLWARDRDEVGAERLDVEVDVRRGLDGVDVEQDARAAPGPAPTISAIGWIVPTSLLASMIETRIVLVGERRLELVGIDPAVAVDRQLDDLEAELLEVAQGVTDRVVLDRRGHDPVAARLARPRPRP